jgi:uncharacterized coiled-coil protein SlyX
MTHEYQQDYQQHLLHALNRIANALEAQHGASSGLHDIAAKLQYLYQQGAKMANTLDELTASVAAQTTDIASVKTLLDGLRAQIAALPSISPADQAKIDTLFTSITGNNTALEAMTAAVVTPGDGTGVPV